MERFFDTFYSECGVRRPEPNEQDWEICAGDFRRTGEYIDFYERHASEMSAYEKDLLVMMIVQGIEDHLNDADDQPEFLRLWARTKEIIIRDNLRRIAVYWSCIGEPLEDCWCITPYMRKLL